ncbi:hypothetical protein AYR66_22970 [Noviherbaspirillum denitrificans]|uniref:DUF3025 domain-containing protein n=1 Tax=Noviherbaspirillum denitrificans TaxID=1968433 RepID=A0A254TLB7_9BURK|nr:hypothetical protein AYR66_22970 [Noviherbaspirillum denitrificans]
MDWQRPWLDSIRNAAAPVIGAGDWRVAVNETVARTALVNHLGKPVHFVPQADLPAGMAYEAFISASGGVPTRDNLHDFFNALVWLTFPRIKVQLNALQAGEIARAGDAASGSRGRMRDAATLFDENAAVLVVRDASMLDALRSHCWREAFLDRKHDFWNACEVWLFGHALMEKLVHPYKAITAHAWPVIAGVEYGNLSHAEKTAWIDDAVSRQLQAGLSTSGFTPLPVLGVPTWWEGQDAAFYADATVFRPKHRS